ncbi:MAG: 2-polyprenyl-3-methyl-6-methoxy-1,4-benzoquinone monooxygenase [Methylophaga sp.]|nr:2-polyprenyl-3-methyl-6-methoxy-1,4-benzoquinone monooxygenase [Methylophaga sp.]
MQRQINFADKCVLALDKALTTIWGKPQGSGRKSPAADLPEAALSAAQRHHNAALMRVNHAGEVSAQALYQGQALTAKLPVVRQAMQQAAAEENDHLIWCQQRLTALNGHRSLLNPVWYAGSFALGAMAGIAGDKWSLGFVAETEKQVEAHLIDHLGQLNIADAASEAVLRQMQTDEIHHGQQAIQAGGVYLPLPVKKLMTVVSKVMTRSSYWL